MSDDKTHFGYKTVDADAKAGMVGEVFHSVAEKYDVMNDLMSFGIHRVWKRYTIEQSAVRPGHVVLDLDGGTGDLAAKFSRRVSMGGRVDKDKALESMLRVLKPGGRLLVLEFSKPVLPLLSKAYDAYSFTALPFMGKLVANDADSYRYLAESIRMHPDQETLKGMMDNAGFFKTSYHNMTGGVVALHKGFKV